MTDDSDCLQRYLFENQGIRGERVQLTESYQTILGKQSYPAPVRALLGELSAAAVLLAAPLKHEARVIIQAQGDGPVSLLMADCSHNLNVRALAKCADEIAEQSLPSLLGEGRLAITIEPADGERYQGIVPLEGYSLAECLEGYFQRSEQLATTLFLAADGAQAGGLLLQKIPEQAASDADAWSRVTQLSATLTERELLTLANETLLRRLYHEEDVRVFDRQPVAFHCHCSRERTSNALRSLGEAELKALLAEQGHISVDCEFCHQRYDYDAVDVERLIQGGLSDAPDHPQ